MGLRQLPVETFVFLAYTLGRFYLPWLGSVSLGVRRYPRKVRRLRPEIVEMTDRRWSWLIVEWMMPRLNR